MISHGQGQSRHVVPAADEKVSSPRDAAIFIFPSPSFHALDYAQESVYIFARRENLAPSRHAAPPKRYAGRHAEAMPVKRGASALVSRLT